MITQLMEITISIITLVNLFCVCLSLLWLRGENVVVRARTQNEHARTTTYLHCLFLPSSASTGHGNLGLTQDG